MTYLFEIPDPMGAVRQTQRSKWVDPAAIRYNAYRKRVRLLATAAGVPLNLPKRPGRAEVAVRTFFPGAAAFDADNALKGVLDALWSNDRRALKVSSESLEDQPCAEAWSLVEVTISV